MLAWCRWFERHCRLSDWDFALITSHGPPSPESNSQGGRIVMLLKNLDTKRELCNETKMVVVGLRRFNFKARLLNAPRQDKDIVLLRIPLITTKNDDLSFKFFSLTIFCPISFLSNHQQVAGTDFWPCRDISSSTCFHRTWRTFYVRGFFPDEKCGFREIANPHQRRRNHYHRKNVVFREVLW